MNKSELIEAVAEKTSQSRIKVGEVLEAIINQIVASDKTQLKGFGIFSWRVKPARPARTGRNPRTGEPIKIESQPESTTLHFKPSAGMKDL